MSKSKISSYDMSHPFRGKAIIFNQKEFDNMSDRTGTETDVENLSNVLPKLGFSRDEIYIYHNLTAEEILNKLHYVQKEDHTNNDLLMIFLLTHGNEKEEVFGTDKKFSVAKLWEPFTAEKCKSLAGKPKIFIVVACRGELQDRGADVTLNDPDVTEVDAKISKEANYYSYTIPIWSDFLYVFSTYQGFTSFRDVWYGTWYIQAFCHQLRVTDIEKVSFTDFLAAVNEQVQKFESHDFKKQISVYMSTLTRTLFFKNSKNKKSDKY